MYSSSTSKEMMTLILAKCVCAHNLHTNIYREDNKVQKATSFCLCFFFSFFLLLFHLPLSLWQQAWSHLSNPTTNTHTDRYTHSAGTYTVSELQRHPAVGVGVHFLKLWFPPAYQCNCKTETYNSCTRKLFIEEYTATEDFHRYGRTVISCKTILKVKVGEGARKNKKREARKDRDKAIKKTSERRKHFLAPLN